MRCAGASDLFGREDIVDAQWRIVEPILDNVTPLYHLSSPAAGGRTEADALIGGDGPWRNPQAGEVTDRI